MLVEVPKTYVVSVKDFSKKISDVVMITLHVI